MSNVDNDNSIKLIIEQLINNVVEQQKQQSISQLVPLTPSQIDKKSQEISNRFLNNIFASVKDSLGEEYYDDVTDVLNKNVKLKQMLAADLKMYISKVINSSMKQTTGKETETAGVNKTNVNA